MNAVTENNYNSMDDSEDIEDIQLQKGNGCSTFLALVLLAVLLMIFGAFKFFSK